MKRRRTWLVKSIFSLALLPITSVEQEFELLSIQITQVVSRKILRRNTKCIHCGKSYTSRGITKHSNACAKKSKQKIKFIQ